jgi:hypothetical protein
MDYTDQRPLDSLIVDVYAPGNSKFPLYEDDGISLDYSHGKSAVTPLTCVVSGSVCRFTIGAARGEYAGQTMRRSYLVRLYGHLKPSSVTIDGTKIAPGGAASDRWNWDAQRQSLVLNLGRRSIRKSVSLEIR